MDLRCLIRGHRPEKDVGRFEDCFYGQRMVGRTKDYDRIYETIVCRYCGKQIHIPNVLKPDGRKTIWRVKENDVRRENTY